jgi:hypothetical protein
MRFPAVASFEGPAAEGVAGLPAFRREHVAGGFQVRTHSRTDSNVFTEGGVKVALPGECRCPKRPECCRVLADKIEGNADLGAKSRAARSRVLSPMCDGSEVLS